MLEDGKERSDGERLTSVLEQGPAMAIVCSMNIVKSLSVRVCNFCVGRCQYPV